MNDPQVGWIAAIIIGGVAGWLAEQFMKSQMGLLMNIVLGIVGAVIASWLFSMLGVSLGGGWLGYLIAGFIGAPAASGHSAAHSITSLALASSVVGTDRPRVLAVFRLMTSSYFVGACTGRSAGFSPLKMRST